MKQILYERNVPSFPPGLMNDRRLRRRSRWRRRTDLRRPIFASCAVRRSNHQRSSTRRLAAEIRVGEITQPSQRSAAHIVLMVVVVVVVVVLVVMMIAWIIVLQEARHPHHARVLLMLRRRARRRRQRRKQIVIGVHGHVSVVILDGSESGRR